MAAVEWLCSCDHLDLYSVPPGVWESRLPRAVAGRGPRVDTRDGRPRKNTATNCAQQYGFPA